MKSLLRSNSLTLLISLLAFFLLSACNTTPSSNVTPPQPPLVPVAIPVLEAVLQYFVKRKKLLLTGEKFKHQVSRHKGFFVWVRARYLGERNPEWVTEPDQSRLRNRVESEFDEVVAYIAKKIGTKTAPGPYAGGTDPVTPPLLDLKDVSRQYAAEQDDSASVKRRLKSNLQKRKRWTIGIVWRAAAIYEGLWKPSADGMSATLKKPEMDEILDRRLRVIERMAHNVSSGNGRAWPKTLPGPDGPWRDGFRVRMFEYPRVPNNALFKQAIGNSNIEFNPKKQFTTSKPWRIGERGTRFEYNVAQRDRDGNGRLGLYFPPSQSKHWLSSGYGQILFPNTTTPAEVLDDMFFPHPPEKWEDWWGRTWMWCDHVLAALNLEALLLGKRRRDGNANAFNNLVNVHGKYILVDDVVGRGDANILMADDTDPFFENPRINVNELQIGDHLIFWNSFIYNMISHGDWRLENALVMNIDSDPKGGILVAGKPPSYQLRLQGHGTSSKAYGAYTDEIADKLRGAMEHLQNEVIDEVNNNPAITSFQYSEQPRTQIVRWSPYEIFDPPGAWWIKINLDQAREGWRLMSVDEVVTAIKKSVGHVPGSHVILDDEGKKATRIPVGPGYNPPTDSEAVYFPIFVPPVSIGKKNTLNDGWYAYLIKRSIDATFRPRTSKLEPLLIDGTSMPGIFYRGVQQPIPIVRPKVN